MRTLVNRIESLQAARDQQALQFEKQARRPRPPVLRVPLVSTPSTLVSTPSTPCAGSQAPPASTPSTPCGSVRSSCMAEGM
jgi:hypothetical protein